MHSPTKDLLRDGLPGLGLLFALVAVYFLCGRNYLLYHSVAEIFSVVIAFATFAVAWNSRRWLSNGFLLVVGSGYFFVALIDLLHAFTYRGMRLMPTLTSDAPTQLWVAGRLMQAVTLVAAPLFLTRRPRTALLFAGLTLATAALLMSILVWPVFPACFVEGQGLTRFKVLSEFLISLMFALSVLLMVRHREQFDSRVLAMFGSSVAMMIVAEMSFSLYVSVDGPANMVGHLLKVFSFYLVYQALVVTGFTNPYQLLFRGLKASEQSLQKALAEKEILLKEIHHRVKNNLQVISSLLHLQTRSVDDERMLEILQENRSRVHAIALVHDKLYRSHDLKSVDLKEYLAELCADVVRSYGVQVDLELRLSSTAVSVETAIPCGLIVQELISNSIKYGVKGAGGKIRLHSSLQDGQVQLTVRDDGPGYPEEMPSKTLGFQLIKGLSRQLHGEFSHFNEQGAVGTLVFPAA